MKQRRTSPQVFYNAHELRHNLTEAEAKLWQILRTHPAGSPHFRRQHAIGPYIVDFCAPSHKLVIELDGSQHLDQPEYDAERTAYLESRGYRVLRFWNAEVLRNPDGVWLVILEALGISENSL
jgi:very-short-patch-repair endonuclease